MKQRHSYHRLFYHLVIHVKDRTPFIMTPDDESEIAGYLGAKSKELDACIEELGTWYEHLHMLLRASPNMALSQLYRQLKGFCSRAWNLRHPERRLAWGDGVFISTVDPDRADELRRYIRNQRAHHSEKQLVSAWESD